VLVVDDLVADVDGGAVGLEGLVDDQDGAVDAGAEPARRSEEQGVGSHGGEGTEHLA
jgi:hypothetical protein